MKIRINYVPAIEIMRLEQVQFAKRLGLTEKGIHLKQMFGLSD